VVTEDPYLPASTDMLGGEGCHGAQRRRGRRVGSRRARLAVSTTATPFNKPGQASPSRWAASASRSPSTARL